MHFNNKADTRERMGRGLFERAQAVMFKFVAIMCMFLVMADARAQNDEYCFAGGSFSSQEEVDAITGPACPVISQLGFSGESITDLSSLTELELQEVKYFSVSSTGLIDLDGLESLKRVQFLSVIFNQQLQVLNLQVEDIGFVDDPSCVGCTNSQLSIIDNPALVTIDLPELTSVGTDGLLSSYIAIALNDSLQSLDGLESLREVYGGFAIANNLALTDITALSGVTRVDGFDNGNIAGGLSVFANLSLTDCSVFAPLFGYPLASDLASALSFGNVGINIGMGSEGTYVPIPIVGLGNLGDPNGEGANSVKECIDAYAAVQPEALIEELIAYVADLNTSNGISNALDAKLSVVERALGDANENNDVAALNAMYAFCDNAEAQSGKQLDANDVDDLISLADRIIQAIDPFAPACAE